MSLGPCLSIRSRHICFERIRLGLDMWDPNRTSRSLDPLVLPGDKKCLKNQAVDVYLQLVFPPWRCCRRTCCRFSSVLDQQLAETTTLICMDYPSLGSSYFMVKAGMFCFRWLSIHLGRSGLEHIRTINLKSTFWTFTQKRWFPSPSKS